MHTLYSERESPNPLSNGCKVESLPLMQPPSPETVPGLWLPKGWESWESLMDEALREAHKALLLDEVPVGAVVVDANGTVIGRGHNSPISSCNPTAHAELTALCQAAQNVGNYRLNQAFLVVTLEPCLMCAGAVVHSRLQGVVFGASDFKTGALCSRIGALDLQFHNHKTVWAGGVKQKECGELLSSFFKKKRQTAKTAGLP